MIWLPTVLMLLYIYVMALMVTCCALVRRPRSGTLPVRVLFWRGLLWPLTIMSTLQELYHHRPPPHTREDFTRSRG